ncbi:DNA polymerase III subunit beta [Opitutaceae bacterium TAV4]|nr:DNA polymerase III subunit beta [Opitutaceae bacterium TAV4]RRJ98410.1 DNA polymerase III subunit beta [Opitutaceae bacterium TAV3]
MISFTKETLREALSGLRVLKPAKQAHPALCCIRVTGTTDAVRFEATNLDEHLLFEGAGKSDGTPDTNESQVLVPWETLNGIVKTADSGSTISVQSLPQSSIRCVSKGVAVDLPFVAQPLPDYPAVPGTGGRPPMGIPSCVLASMVEAAACASTDANRYLLNSVFVEKHAVVACDGRQLYTRNSLDLPLPDEGIAFPSSKVPAVISKTAGDTLLFWTWKHDGHPVARIAAGPWLWTAKLVEGKYPDWRQVVPKFDGYKAHLRIAEEDAERLKTVLPQLPGYKDEHSPVCLTIRAKGAFLTPPPHLPQVRVDLDKSRVLAAPDSKSADGLNDVQFDANYLLGALQRGFRDLHVQDDVTPIVMRDNHRVNLWIPNRPRIGPPPARTSTTPSVATATTPKAADVSDASSVSSQAASTNENKTTTDNPTHTSTRNESTAMVAIAHQRTTNTTPARTGGNTGTPGIVTSAQQSTQPHVIVTPEAQTSSVDAAQQSIQHARDLLRELNGTLGNLQVFIRESVRQHKALERDHETLKKNIRALRTVEV